VNTYNVVFIYAPLKWTPKTFKVRKSFRTIREYSEERALAAVDKMAMRGIRKGETLCNWHVSP
jgi:hypothetical protein